jgi:hypothetical protein
MSDAVEIVASWLLPSATAPDEVLILPRLKTMQDYSKFLQVRADSFRWVRATLGSTQIALEFWRERPEHETAPPLLA